MRFIRAPSRLLFQFHPTHATCWGCETPAYFTKMYDLQCSSTKLRVLIFVIQVWSRMGAVMPNRTKKKKSC